MRSWSINVNSRSRRTEPAFISISRGCVEWGGSLGWGEEEEEIGWETAPVVAYGQHWGLELRSISLNGVKPTDEVNIRPNHMFQFNNDLSIEQKERILTLTTTRLPSRRQILCVPVSYPYYDLLRSIQITTESTSSNKQGVLFSYVTSGFSMYIQQARYKVCPTSIQHAADINSKYKQY